MMKIFSVPVVRLALLLCTALYSGSVQAQWNQTLVGGKFNNEPGFYSKEISTIPVRAAGHDTYSRLVVDWPGKVFYEVEDDNKKGRVLIKFKRRAQIDMTEVRTAPSTNFGSVEVLSGLNEPLVLAITIPPEAKHKVYSIGYKVILDVDDVPGQKRGDFKRDAVEKKAPKAPDPMTVPSVNPEGSIQPETEVADSPDKIIPQTIINWTSTKNFDMAAFARHNIIYIVTSNTDMTFAPRITDGDKKLNLTRIPTEEGNVYRIVLPVGAVPRLITAGANLSWDLTINSPSKPAPARAVFKMSGEKNDIGIDLPLSGRIVTFKDPDTGENYTVLPAASAQNYSDKSLKTPDLEILPSAAGLVLRTFNDKIDITLNDSNVLLSLPQGFAYEPSMFTVKPDKSVTDAMPAPLPGNAVTDSKRLLTFNRWTATLPHKYAEARQILEKKLLESTPDKKAENLINLARFELAQGYGPEALGYLNLALEKAPSLDRNPEYHALRGVSLALMGDSENALPDLNDPLLQTFPEMGMWRAFALSLDYDWQEAFKALPADMSALPYYPRRIQSPLSLAIAEILLRNNKPLEAVKLLDTLARNVQMPSEHEKAAIGYLRGEALRLQNQPVKAIEAWNKVAKSKDQLYRVKAILAQTLLQLQERAITPKEAIEKLERLRFAWRGDGLETQIAQVLGRQYLANKQWDEAFDLMRGAAGFAQGTQEGDAITSAMTQSFSQLFTNPPPDLKPIEAIALYDRFPELTPPGQEGKAVLRGLANYLLQVDLLDRAAGIYTRLLPQDTNGVEILNDGLQLAAIHLLAREPDKALKAIDDNIIASARGTPEQMRQRILLRARALSDSKKYQDAFDVLSKVSIGDDSLALITDTAWAAGRWDLAARSLDMILQRSQPDVTTLTTEQLDIIFNRAVALRLANNAKELSSIRAQYLDKITDSGKRTQFEVITRPAATTTLADRDTMLNMVQEVDLFKSFLGKK